MTTAALVVGGLVALLGGAEVVVRAGTNLAGWLGISPMVIGLTVVSLGTSVPELAVGIAKSWPFTHRKNKANEVKDE